MRYSSSSVLFKFYFASYYNCGHNVIVVIIIILITSLSNKECEWLILSSFIREQCTADAILLLRKINFGLKIQRMSGEIIGFFIIKQINKPPQCSVLW